MFDDLTDSFSDTIRNGFVIEDEVNKFFNKVDSGRISNDLPGL